MGVCAETNIKYQSLASFNKHLGLQFLRIPHNLDGIDTEGYKRHSVLLERSKLFLLGLVKYLNSTKTATNNVVETNAPLRNTDSIGAEAIDNCMVIQVEIPITGKDALTGVLDILGVGIGELLTIGHDEARWKEKKSWEAPLAF
ncbi:LOW QUALITY PROTEIN: hypothetical protein MKX08_001731 [Trichoderma sp. CBMAI-0020]|nr:LOW QUALITY PROTEIN: hypothetical protein MKX08_001731 [Trichoderma sp. CBMAI-0020]